MSLQPRKIGTSLVHPIGFGAMGISVFYGKTESDEERLKVLDAAYAKGCNHWDSAALYGDSEVLIGKWFKKTGKRSEIFLATKFGVDPTTFALDSEPESVKAQCAKALQRLGIDYIDLFYQHRPDPKVPIELTVRALAELVKEGKIKNIGLSECTAQDLRRAHAVHPISALQVEFSPFVLDIESDQIALLKTARELGVTIVVYSPLARGLITGQFKSPDDFEPNDVRRTIPKYSAENFPKILDVVNSLKEIGTKYNATAGQVTLAWILAQGDDFVVIPGTKKIKYLEENMDAEKVHLTPEEVAAIRKLAEDSEKNIPGTRYANMESVLIATPPLK